MLLPSRRRHHGRGHSGASLPFVGCLLLLVAFIAVAVLQRSAHHRGDRRILLPGSGGGVAGGGSARRITIFSYLRPPAAEGSPTRQELAVWSWLALPGNVTVVLLGARPPAFALAERLGDRVTVEPAIDSSFTGTPFFHSMIARAQTADSDICLFVDADTVLLPEIVTLLTKISKIERDWFMVSMPPNISDFPYQLADNGMQWVQADYKEVSSKNWQQIPSGKWAEDHSDRGLIMAWNNPGSALHSGILPSFLYGRGLHNWWLIHEVLSSEMRLVFDASSLVLGLYPENFSTNDSMISSVSNDALVDGLWEYSVNHHLAAIYGSYCCQFPSAHSPMLYKVVKKSENYLLSKVEGLTLADFVMGKDQSVHAGGGSLPGHLESYSSESSKAVDTPYSLEMLLQLVADKNRSIVLAVAGASYRDMLMSWVCRLRHLGVTNFVVCALDHETYEFSVLQGLPVFRDPLSPKNVSFDGCHFGTQCFQRVTKVKSRIVLKILRLGFNVLLSDVDVYWFKNPLQYLHSLGPATIAAQSDEYNETGPINLPRRLNSGFYFARSDDATIAAMEMIVEHAARSGLSEQPSFYDVLCGEGGANRVGGDGCLELRTNLTVVFLDRRLFPNGAYGGLWEKRDVRSACGELGCLVLHNNWVSGRRKKLRRQVSSGLWNYDPASRLCLQRWTGVE